MKQAREKRIMILLRIVLAISGIALGIIAMWQALDFFAIEINPGIALLFYIAASITLGGIFLLSAPLIRIMFHKVARYWRTKFKDFKVLDIAGITVGVIVGLSIAFLINFIFEVFLPIVALRLFIAIVFGLVTAFITTLGISSWLGKVIEAETTLEESGLTARSLKGFLLTHKALRHSKILVLSENWLEGSVFVLAKLAQHFEEMPADKRLENTGYKNYKTLKQKNLIKILDYFSPKAFDDELEIEYYIDAAIAKKVKIVTTTKGMEDFKNVRSAVVLNLDELL